MIPLPPNAKIKRMSRCSHRSQRVHNASAVVSVKDRDLRYIFVNHEPNGTIMFEGDAICCNTDFDTYPRAVAEAVRINNRKAVEAGVPIQFEEAVPADTGTCCYIATKFLLRDANGKPSAVCAIGTAITALKRAEELEAKLAIRARDVCSTTCG